MKANFKARNPDDIDFTLTITMTLKEWKELNKHVGYNENWPIAKAISEMRIKAEQSFYSDIGGKEDE